MRAIAESPALKLSNGESIALDFGAMLAARRWCVYEKPFPHIRASNVFTARLYDELVAGFETVLARGLSETTEARRFSRLSGYDAYGLSFSDYLHPAFTLFVSRAWHDLVAGLFDVETTRDIRGGLHHHRTGSRDGQIHNDLNPGWFVDRPNADGVNVANLTLCNYFNGDTSPAAGPPRQTVRGIAMLYYLANGAWRPGDGGETGLYLRAGGPIAEADARIPPIDNTMLLFECTPWSYHTFLANPRKPRNSVIMWLHRPETSVIARWGEGRIVPWLRARSR
jgi:hypothetical protein